MESGQGKHRRMIQVVWLCHFDNAEIASLLGVKTTFEFAPWIWRFIQIFSETEDLRITVIMPYKKILRSRKLQLASNIELIVYPDYRVPALKGFQRKLNMLFNFPLHSKKTKSMIQALNPDLIHLFGAENPYYACSVLRLRESYPVFLTIQGIVSLNLKSDDKWTTFRKVVENELIGNLKYFGIRDASMRQHIEKHNKNPKFFYHDIAINRAEVRANISQTYDLVYFARIDPSKGIEDFLKITASLAKTGSVHKVVVIGRGEKDYLNYLFKLTESLGIVNVVEWRGPLPTIEEVHGLVADSKVVVLPTYNDTIPGTILESIQIGVPVVSYPIGGIPSLNEERESVALAKTGDLNSLVNEVGNLLSNPERRNDLVKNALLSFKERWGDDVLRESIKEAYEGVLENG